MHRCALAMSLMLVLTSTSFAQRGAPATARTAPMLNREVVTYLTDTFPHENGIEGFMRVYGSVRPGGSVAAKLVIVSNRAVIVNSVLKAKELLLKTGDVITTDAGRANHSRGRGAKT